MIVLGALFIRHGISKRISIVDYCAIVHCRGLPTTTSFLSSFLDDEQEKKKRKKEKKGRESTANQGEGKTRGKNELSAMKMKEFNGKL